MYSHQQRFNLNNGTTWAKQRKNKKKVDVADDESLSAFIICANEWEHTNVYMRVSERVFMSWAELSHTKCNAMNVRNNIKIRKIPK